MQCNCYEVPAQCQIGIVRLSTTFVSLTNNALVGTVSIDVFDPVRREWQKRSYSGASGASAYGPAFILDQGKVPCQAPWRPVGSPLRGGPAFGKPG